MTQRPYPQRERQQAPKGDTLPVRGDSGRRKATRGRRWYEYNCLTHLKTGLPVLTTVIYLFPPELEEEPAYRVQLGGNNVILFPYNVVNLWQLGGVGVGCSWSAGARPAHAGRAGTGDD